MCLCCCRVCGLIRGRVVSDTGAVSTYATYGPYRLNYANPVSVYRQCREVGAYVAHEQKQDRHGEEKQKEKKHRKKETEEERGQNDG